MEQISLQYQKFWESGAFQEKHIRFRKSVGK